MEDDVRRAPEVNLAADSVDDVSSDARAELTYFLLQRSDASRVPLSLAHATPPKVSMLAHGLEPVGIKSNAVMAHTSASILSGLSTSDGTH